MLFRAPGGAQQEEHMRVSGRVSQHVRRVADGDAARLGGGHVDMVVAHAGRGNHADGGRQLRYVLRAYRHAEGDQQAVRLVLVGKRDHLVRLEMPVRRNAREQSRHPVLQRTGDRQ